MRKHNEVVFASPGSSSSAFEELIASKRTSSSSSCFALGVSNNKNNLVPSDKRQRLAVVNQQIRCLEIEKLRLIQEIWRENQCHDGLTDKNYMQCSYMCGEKTQEHNGYVQPKEDIFENFSRAAHAHSLKYFVSFVVFNA